MTDHPPQPPSDLPELDLYKLDEAGNRRYSMTFEDGVLTARFGDTTVSSAELERLRARVEVIDHQMQGVCPSCGHHSLTVDERGYLACHWSMCERPDAAALILAGADPDHILYVDDEGFTIRHPLHERLDDALLTCDLHIQMEGFAASGRRWPPGRYRVSYDDHMWAFEPIESEAEADRAT